MKSFKPLRSAVVFFISALLLFLFFGAGKSFAKEQNNLNQKQKEILTVSTACGKYSLKNGIYPQNLKKLIQDGYLKKIPVDPKTKGKEYDYMYLKTGCIIFNPGISAETEESVPVFMSGFANNLGEYFIYKSVLGLFYSCEANLRNIFTACEMYNVDHNGIYPSKLEDLIPEYLKNLPKCPSAEKMTYVYNLKNAKDYTIYCSGENHKDIIGDNEGPRFNYENGLEKYKIKQMQLKDADLTGCKQNLINLGIKSEEYAVKSGIYPQTLDELVKNGFLKELPVCPLCNQMRYKIFQVDKDGIKGIAIGCDSELHKKDENFSSFLSCFFEEKNNVFVEAQEQGVLTACKSNLKNLAVSLEMYAVDHKGIYPPELKALIPTYLEKLPKCPSCDKMTYKYKRAGETSFVVYCEGKHHKAENVTGPAYGGNSGLVDNIEAAK